MKFLHMSKAIFRPSYLLHKRWILDQNDKFSNKNDLLFGAISKKIFEVCVLMIKDTLS